VSPLTFVVAMPHTSLSLFPESHTIFCGHYFIDTLGHISYAPSVEKVVLIISEPNKRIIVSESKRTFIKLSILPIKN